MSVNAVAIRRERYVEIGAIVRRDNGILIDRWARRAAQEQPHARRVHHEVLLDHLPGFLNELGAHLASAGEAADDCRHRGPAHRHGEQRWEAGWSLAEVVRDYRLLRLVVLEHLDESLDRHLRLREVMAVGLALDEAIEASVARYVHSRDEEARQAQSRYDAERQKMEDSLRRQTDALRDADRRKNEFLATLAHELRNPLSPLRNALEVVRLSGEAPPTFLQARELMERQVQQLGRLVDDLMDMARIAQGKLALRLERIDLRAVLREAVQVNAPIIETRRQQLSVSLAESPLWVDGDPARLVQVVVNLLNNAAKYTPESGRISLAAVRDGADIVMRVADSGVGIPATMLTHIFDLFTQLDIGPERAQTGLGIGLTLVRRLIELHGGTITAASAGEGRGSEFTVRLPAVAAPTEAPPAPGAKSKPQTRSRAVLIVEDNDDGRDSLALLLRLAGHRVSMAADGQRGVEAAAAGRPEIALIDIGLPDMDGYQLAERFRADFGPNVLLVALTGYGQPEDRERALRAGFNFHLTKPVEPATLHALLAGGNLQSQSGLSEAGGTPAP